MNNSKNRPMLPNIFAQRAQPETIEIIDPYSLPVFKIYLLHSKTGGAIQIYAILQIFF